MHQTWGKLLFMHWRINENVLRPHIPEELEIDTVWRFRLDRNHTIHDVGRSRVCRPMFRLCRVSARYTS
jgi:hypothetical protein